MRWPLRHAGKVVAISDFTADQIATFAGVTRNEIAVVPVSIDDTFVPIPLEGAREIPNVLCFASTPNKNFERALEAVRGMPIHLSVVGMLDQATQSKLVESGLSWTNASGLTDDDLRRWYVESDVVLFPSTYEGFGMPIVEAQATGRPVVTSDRAPMNDVAGGAACLVDPEDVGAIRTGLERVLNDASYRDELIRKGYENRERFRPVVAARAYAAIYREMAGKT